ncbi:crossover junction endodeoxyribonuclease RuvC [Actinomarinicola tropica]|uniref:Crossover junction endodeoxyribonuclease RuvC n=1 Tax=Actinomarinicola tropica TaxID=2789776 RepID=A0A5Q2RMN7_9ACTN|nr:crossover junction endodeoxyribonuclease RuvC [Actinomarinicola tropica]QGG95150.1 crossover junction endodeoxyribonuclease RuvC [Actinomarinicola tropica]
MFVLGIDPGVSRCGYAIVEPRAGRPRPVAIGIITTPPDAELPLRLAELQHEVRGLFDDFAPAVVAIERVFFQHNVRTAMSVGQASGLVMAEAASRGCVVAQYSPNEVKQAVTGDGAADKTAVATMVQTLLGLPRPPRPADAADAAALALCHIAHAPLAAAAEAAR